MPRNGVADLGDDLQMWHLRTECLQIRYKLHGYDITITYMRKCKLYIYVDSLN